MASSFLQPGDACRRSRLPGWLRLVITFAVGLGLKYTLPLLGVTAALQVIVLLVVLTGFAWFFWWNCSPDRRGVAILVGLLWLAGLVKLIRQ
jgi:hypothetical protein